MEKLDAFNQDSARVKKRFIKSKGQTRRVKGYMQRERKKRHVA